MLIDADHFAAAWIADWNSHDLDRILGHYAEEILFLSPAAARLAGGGRLSGKSALRDYWAKALARYPDMRFTLEAVYAGFASATIVYRGVGDRRVAETFEFGADGRVVRAIAAYTAPAVRELAAKPYS